MGWENLGICPVFLTMSFFFFFFFILNFLIIPMLASGILLSPPSVCPSVRLSVRLSVMLSPPKPLDRIQLNLVSGLLTQVGCARACLFLAPPSRGPEEGSKSQILTSMGFAMACHRLPDLVIFCFFVCVLFVCLAQT